MFSWATLSLVLTIVLRFLAPESNNQNNADYNQGLSLLAGTSIFLVIGIISNLLVSWDGFPGQDKPLLRTVVTYTTVCLWVPWMLVYMSQMFPLPGVFPLFNVTCGNVSYGVKDLVGPRA